MSFINNMAGQEYIDKTREYLDYLEEHLENVRRAFQEISEACEGMMWVGDDYSWHTIRQEVILHDLSKFSKYEFTQYRDKFFPTQYETDDIEITENFNSAWENHKKSTHHHWETIQNYIGVVHMVVDWTAMGYKFGDTAKEYYEANEEKIIISKDLRDFMYDIFDKIDANKKSKII